MPTFIFTSRDDSGHALNAIHAPTVEKAEAMHLEEMKTLGAPTPSEFRVWTVGGASTKALRTCLDLCKIFSPMHRDCRRELVKRGER